jgi:outer membrane lipoprotein-sorting protein
MLNRIIKNPIFAAPFILALLASLGCQAASKDAAFKMVATEKASSQQASPEKVEETSSSKLNRNSQKAETESKSTSQKPTNQNSPKDNRASSQKIPIKKSDPNLDEIKKIVGAYQTSSGLEMGVRKEVYIDYTEETKKGQGKLYFSKSRLRLEMESPDKYLLLLNKNVIWMENHLPKELGGIQVSKVQASKKVKESNALLAFLFDNANVWDGFELTKSPIRDKSSLKLSLKPKTGQDLGDIVNMELELDTQKKHLNRISYLDSLDNRTTYEFLNIIKKNKIKDQMFEYKPPKGVPVTEL